ncbi:homeobox-leucine zipper protein HOX11-like [Heracleum sosnowskyi]|uniref:Homeobox-leucine zipper protein HOX11-like n=1 Tax=Heracleum sosnowskyi TaxID=360622 RepID=A0AAD8HCN0_9APIA|nr:homeobox-leucine zipper protein HOX11-like [Heracleum sosnowskyi]
MELELSLGVSSSLKPFVDVAQKSSTSKVLDLSFDMGLSLPSESTDDEVEDKEIEKLSSGEPIKDKTPSFPSILDLAKDGGNVGNKRSLDYDGNQVVEGKRESNSKASDEDENGMTRKKLRLSKQQSAFLEESFVEFSSTLNPKQKHALAKQLNLRPRQVEVWFQNRRARTKLKQTESDCEYLKRYFETLTKENKKLQKELQELRALKTSSPFYMQSPATTLTTCPSCHERVSTSTPSSTTAIVTSAKPTTAGSLTPLPFPLS